MGLWRGIWLCSSIRGVQKGKQVASSTKWGLKENVVLWQMNIWITISHLFVSHLGVNNITGYANALSLGLPNNFQKRNVATLNSAHQTKNGSKFDSGWNNNSAVYIASSKSSESKGFVRRLNKVETKYIQEEQSN